jgi:tetratricopeptide (TPR) repeat protein
MISETKKKLLEMFAEGRKQYKLMRFREALEFFGKALKVDPEDGPAKIYYARCKHYLENPPGEDWDGVFVMKTK